MAATASPRTFAPVPTHWPRILCSGAWIVITPRWIVRKSRHGLTPREYESLQLAAHQLGLSVGDLVRMAHRLELLSIESPS